MNRILEEDAYAVAASSIIPWDRLDGKTVLISGANGYVPAYFVHAFMARNDSFNAGIKVIALCRNEDRAKARFGEYLSRSDFSLRIQDVCDPIEIHDEIHYAIHAASPAGVKNSNLQPASTFAANVIGCLNMLDLSVKKNAERFLLLSSIDTYGEISPNKRFVETDCGALDSMNPRNVYAVAKRSSENLCVCYYEQYKAPVVVVRPSQIMGPGIAMDDGRLHIDFISQMLSSDRIILKSDGKARRTFLYIADAISGMLTAMLYGNPGEAYNIVDEGGEATVLELAELMASIAHERKIEVVFDCDKRNLPEVTNAVSVVTGNSDKLRALGWNPIYSLNDGAERMMRYYGL